MSARSTIEHELATIRSDPRYGIEVSTVPAESMPGIIGQRRTTGKPDAPYAGAAHAAMKRFIHRHAS